MSAHETLRCNCRARSVHQSTWDQAAASARKISASARILRVLCRDKWLDRDGQNRRGVLAVPFLTLGNIELEAVRTGEVPQRAGHRNPHFLIGCPNVPVHP